MTVINKYALILASCWSLLIAGLFMVDLSIIRETSSKMIHREALTNFNKDKALRFWAASHGGIYVEMNEKTPPNPYLDHVAERDIKTPSGRNLTLINPAYMLRQTMERYEGLYGIRGHITSLKYFRAETAPDEWETKNLLSFEQGTKEVSEISQIGEKFYYRMMRPLVANQSCLKCHGHQGYQEGDIRGGVSISVPADSYLADQKKQGLVHGASFALLWLLGLTGGGLAARKIKAAIMVNDTMRGKLKKERDHLEEIVTDRTATIRGQAESAEKQNLEFQEIAYHISQRIDTALAAIRDHTGQWRHISSEAVGHEPELIAKDIDVVARDMTQAMYFFSSMAMIKTRRKVAVAPLLFALREQFRDDGQILFTYEEIPEVYFDEKMLTVLLFCLISNGLKFQKKKEFAEVNVSVGKEGDHYVFSVTDNGIGIDPHFLEKRICTPLARADEAISYPGNGLGLATCKNILDANNERIWIESEKGRGTVVRFTIRDAHQLG